VTFLSLCSLRIFTACVPLQIRIDYYPLIELEKLSFERIRECLKKFAMG
jgi:hypothetical protein